MAGPSVAIREQCPNATPGNDGLMTAAQAAKLESITPGGIVISTALPQELGTAAAGATGEASDAGHVHPNYESVTGAGAIAAGALIKATATAGTYALWLFGESPSNIVGAAVTACSGAGASFDALFIHGAVVTLLSDGTAIIPPGVAVVSSTTVSGCVKAGYLFDSGFLGFNVGPLVAAAPNAPVRVRREKASAFEFMRSPGHVTTVQISDGGFSVTVDDGVTQSSMSMIPSGMDTSVNGDQMIGTSALGVQISAALNCLSIARSKWAARDVGPNLNGGATIQPDSGFHTLSSALTLQTIDPVYITPDPNGVTLQFLPTVGRPWGTSGNIAVAGTMIANRIIEFTYRTATGKWYPSYI